MNTMAHSSQLDDVAVAERILRDDCIWCGKDSGVDPFQGTLFGKYRGKVCQRCILGRPATDSLLKFKLDWSRENG